jgi:hypothetical protein
MPYVSGVLTGIVLTILAVFLIDHLRPDPDARDIVNWDYVGASLGASVEKVGEEVRQEVHEATAPDDKSSSTPRTPDEAKRWAFEARSRMKKSTSDTSKAAKNVAKALAEVPIDTKKERDALRARIRQKYGELEPLKGRNE